MKQLIAFTGLIWISWIAAASAQVPMFSASCPDGYTLESDGSGDVYVNGELAALRQENPSYYTAMFKGAEFGISADEEGANIEVTFTADNADGSCEAVQRFEPSAGAAQDSGDGLSGGTGEQVASFAATGVIRCATRTGQPMGECEYGVARGGKGNAEVTVFWPNGGHGIITFEGGTPTAFSQTGGADRAKMTVLEGEDMMLLVIGERRIEIPSSVVSGD